MHLVKLNNVRFVALALAVAVVLAVSSLGPITTREASAVNISSPQGVICFQLSGAATGIGLVRIDNPTPATVTLTAQTYVQPLGGQPLPSCQNPQSPIPNDAVPSPSPGGSRPTLSGTWTNATDTVAASVCQPDFDFGGVLTYPSATISFTFALAKPPAKSGGMVSFTGYTASSNCTGPTAGPFNLTISGARYLDGPDAAKSTFNSDWDKDGILDWDELKPNLLACSDPFKATPECGVGGVAELPQVAGTPLEANGSGTNVGLIAAVVGAVVASTMALGGAAVYVRRRVTR